MLDHLRPRYAKTFRCIGPECEDTCCHGWNVVIDKSTYEKYHFIAPLRPLAEQHLERLNGNATDSQYAQIKQTPSHDCPFLAPDRLCSIQKEYGEDYLSPACATYPRVKRRIDGLMEGTLLLSCPEAARLVLLNPNLMEADQGITGDRSPYDRLLLMGSAVNENNGGAVRYFWEIRSLTLLLLQDRTYPQWQRLFILGMFCKRLREIISEGQSGTVPKLLKDYAEFITTGKLRSLMDGIPARTGLQLGAVIEIIEHQADPKFSEPSHMRFRECVGDFLRGIRYDPGLPIENCAQFYAEAHSRYYEPFMQEHPYILENYMINYVCRIKFPFGVGIQSEGGNDVQTEFRMLCIQYAAIKGLLIGMAGHYQAQFSPGHVVKLVQSFSKAVEHCPTFLQASNPLMASADGMALLLKI